MRACAEADKQRMCHGPRCHGRAQQTAGGHCPAGCLPSWVELPARLGRLCRRVDRPPWPRTLTSEVKVPAATQRPSLEMVAM